MISFFFQSIQITERFINDGIIHGGSLIKRHLLSTASTSSKGKLFNFKGCVFLYATSIVLTVGNSSVNVVNGSYTASGHCDSNDTTS